MVTTNNPATICGYSFNLEGLKISFIKTGQKFTLSLDPKATAEAIMQAGLIEDWTPEAKTGEPVILFVDNNTPLGYGYELWFQFVKSFPINESLIHSIIEARQEHIENAVFYSKIYSLLLPLRKLVSGAAILFLIFNFSSCRLQPHLNASGGLATICFFTAFAITTKRPKVKVLPEPLIFEAVHNYVGTTKNRKAKRLINLLTKKHVEGTNCLITRNEATDIDTIEFNFSMPISRA